MAEQKYFQNRWRLKPSQDRIEAFSCFHKYLDAYLTRIDKADEMSFKHSQTKDNMTFSGTNTSVKEDLAPSVVVEFSGYGLQSGNSVTYNQYAFNRWISKQHPSQVDSKLLLNLEDKLGLMVYVEKCKTRKVWQISSHFWP